MKKILRILIVCMCCVGLLQSCSLLRNPLKIKNYVEVETTSGSFVVGLYQGTPAHRDNFKEKCSSQFYDGTMLYKSVRNSEYSFGLRDGYTETKVLESDLKNEKSLPAEFDARILPKRGTVAMRRMEGTQNADKKSDACLFFIVDGGTRVTEHEVKVATALKNRDTYKLYIDKFLALPENASLKDSLNSLGSISTMKQYNELYAELMKMVKPQIESDGVELFSVSEKNIEKYVEKGGVPMFEGYYTVFGEISVGMELLDKFSKLETKMDRSPKEKITIVSTKVLNKKEFKKKYK